ncbi:corticoliberin-like [Lepisosteus oculatus]|uniref:corticoliberin-like n=1 Tax=Lepisosteus oculatus TaxID=7918 RepID=UPI0003EAD273|nr:PREDICTED: corticoliberin-like [Lepisosteus oculatus]
MSKLLLLVSSLLVLILPSSSECHPADVPKQQSRRVPSTGYELWAKPPRPELPTENEDLIPDADDELALEEDAPLTKRGLSRMCAAGGPKTSSEEIRDEQDEVRSKRLDAKGKPNSLDLTFHLLREFLEMAKAEKMAQKAMSNKKLMQAIGK